MAELRTGLGVMVKARACRGFDSIEARRWDDLADREGLLLARLRAGASAA